MSGRNASPRGTCTASWEKNKEESEFVSLTFSQLPSDALLKWPETGQCKHTHTRVWKDIWIWMKVRLWLGQRLGLWGCVRDVLTKHKYLYLCVFVYLKELNFFVKNTFETIWFGVRIRNKVRLEFGFGLGLYEKNLVCVCVHLSGRDLIFLYKWNSDWWSFSSDEKPLDQSVCVCECLMKWAPDTHTHMTWHHEFHHLVLSDLTSDFVLVSEDTHTHTLLSICPSMWKDVVDGRHSAVHCSFTSSFYWFLQTLGPSPSWLLPLLAPPPLGSSPLFSLSFRANAIQA